MRTTAKRPNKGAQAHTVRASISFPEEQYKVLEMIAAENKVSLAWVVRDALDAYLKSKWPLLSQGTEAEDAQRSADRS